MTNTRYDVNAFDFSPAELWKVIDPLNMDVEHIAIYKGDICIDLINNNDPRRPERRAHIIYNVGTAGPTLADLNDVRRQYGFDPVSVNDYDWHENGR